MPRNVIIVGPPRSGTSLTSDIFARQGYHMGEGLRCGDDGNPFGYYEAEDLIAANVDLFESVGFPHHNTWKFDPITVDQVATLGRLEPHDTHRQLIEKWNAHSPWMWKDPRFAITLEYWAQFMDRESTGVILTRRDPEDVLWSFHRKGWCDASAADRSRAMGIIDQHAENAALVIERLGLPHITIDYTEYASAPAEVAARISEFTGLKLTAADLNFQSELDHSSGSSRLAGHVRVLLRKLPRGPLKALSRFVPQRIQSLIIPERRFVSESSDNGRRPGSTNGSPQQFDPSHPNHSDDESKAA